MRSPAARSNMLLATVRLAAVTVAGVFCASCLWVEKSLSREPDKRKHLGILWTRRWGRWTCRAIGLRYTLQGTPAQPPVLLAPNHHGYVDIPVMAAATPVVFVAKSEIEGWPVVGAVMRLSGHLFVRRGRVRSLTSVSEQVKRELTGRAAVCVFLEGTSTGGDRVLPYGPSLVQPAVEAQVPVQPVAIRWESRQPGVQVSEDIAYWRDHVIGPHFWRLLGLRGVEATVTFLEPVPVHGLDRKSVAAQARSAVSGALGLPEQLPADPPSA